MNMEPLSVEAGISKQLADWRRKRVSHLSYRLSFIIPASPKEPICGEMSASFQLDTADQDLQFDFKVDGAKVRRVRVNDRSVPVQWERQHIIFNRAYLANGENAVAIDFTAPDQSFNRNDEYLSPSLSRIACQPSVSAFSDTPRRQTSSPSFWLWVKSCAAFMTSGNNCFRDTRLPS